MPSSCSPVGSREVRQVEQVLDGIACVVGVSPGACQIGLGEDGIPLRRVERLQERDDGQRDADPGELYSKQLRELWVEQVPGIVRFGREDRVEVPAGHQPPRGTQVGAQRIRRSRGAAKVGREQGARRQLEVAADERVGKLTAIERECDGATRRGVGKRRSRDVERQPLGPVVRGQAVPPRRLCGPTPYLGRGQRPAPRCSRSCRERCPLPRRPVRCPPCRRSRPAAAGAFRGSSGSV